MPFYHDATKRAYALKGTSSAATATIGSGDNGVVTLTAITKGSIGNALKVAVVQGDGNDVDLAVHYHGCMITVILATDADGELDDTANTAELIADEIDKLPIVSAECSGTGADAVAATEAEVEFEGGIDGSEIVIPLYAGKNTFCIDVIDSSARVYVKLDSSPFSANAGPGEAHLIMGDFGEKPVIVAADGTRWLYVSIYFADRSAPQAGVDGDHVYISREVGG